MKTKSLKINAFLNSLRGILNLIFPLITFPYISRVLSVSGIGKYNFSNSIVSYFVLIAGLGINTYAVREGAKYRDNKSKLISFANEIFTINTCSALIAYVLLFICLCVFVKLHSYVYCILIYSLQIFFSVIGVEWFFTIYEDFTYITIRSMIFQVISIIMLFIFVRHSNDYLNYAAVTVFATVGSNSLNFIRVEKRYHLHLLLKFNWKKHISPILILFAANIANLIYVNSDITILGLMKSNYVVGIYSVSSRIYNIIKSVLSAMLLVTVPRLALLYGKGKIGKYKLLLSKLTNVLLMITIPSMVGLILLSKQVVLIIAGNHFLRSIVSLRILSIAYIFAILAWILCDCVLIPVKREKYLLYSTSLSALINVVLNISMIPFFSENAAAISTVIAEMVTFIVNYRYSKDLVKEIFVSTTLRKTLIDSLVGCIGIIVVCTIVNYFFHSVLVTTVLSVLFSIFVYGLILIARRNTYVLTFLNQIFYRIHK
ncbi:flippase [Limosilactobacillus pontis]|uniref:flippase n=1 Tax=Limosilactobacillus pontis TaxID=35787 RepID=UPI0025A36DF4|nr:flippase [Limosilactobacillus pontis]MDM8332200.1 flippase [Limosilactobacillus pontis]